METLVRDAADSLASTVSRQTTNYSALSAVIEVKVETTVINTQIDAGKVKIRLLMILHDSLKCLHITIM